MSQYFEFNISFKLKTKNSVKNNLFEHIISLGTIFCLKRGKANAFHLHCQKCLSQNNKIV